MVVPPPIQGIGNASGFTMMVELRDGSNDFAKLQRITRTIIADGSQPAGLQRLISPFRAGVPQIEVLVDRIKAETLHVSVGDVFHDAVGYIGSSYVNQFNKFGRTFQVYVQADAQFRLHPDDLLQLYVRSQNGNMVPLGALVTIQPDDRARADHVSTTCIRPQRSSARRRRGFSSGEALSI